MEALSAGSLEMGLRSSDMFRITTSQGGGGDFTKKHVRAPDSVGTQAILISSPHQKLVPSQSWDGQGGT